MPICTTAPVSSIDDVRLVSVEVVGSCLAVRSMNHSGRSTAKRVAMLLEMISPSVSNRGLKFFIRRPLQCTRGQGPVPCGATLQPPKFDQPLRIGFYNIRLGYVSIRCLAGLSFNPVSEKSAMGDTKSKMTQLDRSRSAS